MSQLGLALGSGGARGWCHIGVIRSLQRQGVEPMAVAGCSMGAMVGAAWAAGKLDALEKLALEFTQSQLFSLMDPHLDRGGVLSGKGVETLLSELDLPERIEDLPKPFMAVATDMATGREIWLMDGPLIPAVQASVAIPGIFSPVQLQGRWLIDGGLINPVPVSAARALGARSVLGVNPSGRGGKPIWQANEPDSLLSRIGLDGVRDQLPEALEKLLPEPNTEMRGPSYAEVINAAMDVLTDFVRSTRIAADPPDVMLNADLKEIKAGELYRAQAAITEGTRICDAAEDQIARSLF